MAIETLAPVLLAQRLDRIQEPQTIKMARLGRELRAQGVPLIDLSLGEPDFRTPDFICEAATRAMAAGHTKYPPIAGIPELRQAICEKLRRDNGLHYLPEETIVSTGAKQSLANTILALINPEDEVIIPTPFWVTYAALVSLAEGIPVYVNGPVSQDFKITPAQLEAAITPKTKMFVYSAPCNPTGVVYSKAELAALAQVFERHPQVVIVSDEIYEYINYGDEGHQSIGQFEALRDRTVIVNGFSKGFAMTGWRLGYMAAPKAIVQACEKLQSQFTSGANIISQYAGVEALTHDLSATKEMTAAFHDRRDFVIGSLRQIPDLKVSMPDGAFYAFPDVSAYFGAVTPEGDRIQSDEDVSMYLLNKAYLNTVYGSAFGHANCIRMSYATSMENLEEAMKRIADAFGQLKR